MGKKKISDWNQNGMIIYEYIKLMRCIQNNPDREIDANLKSIKIVDQGITQMLDHLNNDNKNNQQQFDDDDDEHLKKRVCLITMQQRLQTCIVHLTQLNR